MSTRAERFDQWIRSDFVELNTELEELYFSRDGRGTPGTVGAELRQCLHDKGHAHIVALREEGNTDEGFRLTYELLGNVGLYMGACRRHEVHMLSKAEGQTLHDASALALQMSASLGVAPRLGSSHLSTENRAINGVHKSFTLLADERLFLDFSTRGIFAYKRAADALTKTLKLGITHPVTGDLLAAVRRALEDVAASNDHLFEEVDRDRFFNCVRPYYQSYFVGQREYRGTNVSDFAGINVLDLLLGLCKAEDTDYSQLLMDKIPYLLPTDQERLRYCMRQESLMDQILACLKTGEEKGEYFEHNVQLFLHACDAMGKTAVQHYDQLLRRFIQEPTEALGQAKIDSRQVSGSPLEMPMVTLKKIRDLRMAAPRDDIDSRHKDLHTIREALGLQVDSGEPVNS